jgi:hypothetical protein
MKNIHDLRSDNYRPKARSASIFLIALSCVVSFGLAATAQELTYSADSLMAAFEKGSKRSPKGTGITFRDVIVESKNSKVIFKSSRNDKVICELGPATDARNVQLSVGSPLTVIGRVRGRGLMGNVTLDECKLMLTDATEAAPDVVAEEPAIALDTILQEAANAAPEVIPQEPTAAAPPPEYSQEPNEKSVKGRNVQTSAATPLDSTVPEERVALPELEPPNEVINPVSDSIEPGRSYTFYGLVVMVVGLALLALVKLFSLAHRAMGLRKFSDHPNTPETRQAALEALLSGRKKR